VASKSSKGKSVDFGSWMGVGFKVPGTGSAGGWAPGSKFAGESVDLQSCRCVIPGLE
jgi:hypothetical protein